MDIYWYIPASRPPYSPLLEEKGPGGEVHRTIEQRATTDYHTPYTFSAKERDPETGYSYFGARYYDPNVSVWLSVDPLSDKYPSMSAFMYCAGNPVILVDPDGSFIVGSDNKAISYSREASGKILWSPNTTKDVQLIGELLLSTNIGTQLFEAAMTAKYPISIVISEELIHEKLGVCAPDLVLERGKAGPTMKRADITIFKGSIIQLWYDLMVSDCILDGSEGSLVQSSFENTGNIWEVVAAITIHELVHATDKTNIFEYYSNDVKGTSFSTENLPNEKLSSFLIERMTMEKYESKNITTIPTLEWLQNY